MKPIVTRAIPSKSVRSATVLGGGSEKPRARSEEKVLYTIVAGYAVMAVVVMSMLAWFRWTLRICAETLCGYHRIPVP